MAGKQHCRSFSLGVWCPGNTWYPLDIKQMFVGFIIILFVFDSTPKMNNKGCRVKEMEGDKEEVGDRRRIHRRKMTAVTLEHCVK